MLLIKQIGEPLLGMIAQVALSFDPPQYPPNHFRAVQRHAERKSDVTLRFRK